MAPSCLQVVCKLTQSCVKVVPRLSPSHSSNWQIEASWIKVVSKMSPSCLKVVVESKILWRLKQEIPESTNTSWCLNTSIACALQRPKGFPLSCNQYTKVTKKECKMLKSFKTKRKILKHSIIVAFKLLKSAIAFTKKHGLEAKQTKLHNIVSKATSWDLLLIFF